MVESGSFSFAGRDHGLLTELNEAVVLERDCSTHKVVVLCDGAGSCANGKAVAQLTAEAAAGFLSFRFQRCMSDKPAVLRRELAHLVKEVLTGAAEKAGADPDSFGCTVMAAAMDQQGRWCLFHLGGGAAMGQMVPGQDWTVISYPQSVLLSGGTSLTMNCPMFKNLHFYRQSYPSDCALMLMSDGALKLFGAAPQLLEKTALGRGLSEMKTENLPENNCSMACLIAQQTF